MGRRARDPRTVDGAPAGTPDLAQLGGKAAGLVRLLAAELPVPDGFVITTAAYHDYLAAHGSPPRSTAIWTTRARSAGCSTNIRCPTT